MIAERNQKQNLTMKVTALKTQAGNFLVKTGEDVFYMGVKTSGNRGLGETRILRFCDEQEWSWAVETWGEIPQEIELPSKIEIILSQMGGNPDYKFIEYFGYMLGTGAIDIVFQVSTEKYILGFDAEKLCEGEIPSYSIWEFDSLEEAREYARQLGY